MRRALGVLCAGLIGLSGCTLAHNAPQSGLQSASSAAAVANAQSDVEETRVPVTILVSIDGFHPDYLTRFGPPTLNQLAQQGASGPMRPSFPTKTFPNHWTLVTGLVPDKHGIVANRMEDKRRPGDVFTMSTVDPWWWREAKPVWIEAEEAGIRTANMFWPGSAVAWGGTLRRYGPVTDGIMSRDWVPFSMQVGNVQRVNTVLDWLRRPADIRPKFVTLYFDTVDSAGHSVGVTGKDIGAAVLEVDERIAQLVSGLKKMQQPANLVITSDHGMAPISTSRIIAMDKVLDEGTYRMVESGAYATFEALDGQAQALEAKLLAKHERMECWRKSEIPARYEYGTHPRIPPYLCLPHTGWSIYDSKPEFAREGGNHGFDPFAPEMTALFIANGPDIAPGAKVEKFQNTAIAPFLRHLLSLNSDPARLEPLQAALAD